MHFIARIFYNSKGWQLPTGEAGKLEERTTFNALHRFGFEDWLFRGEWQVDGWRYAFIQGVNKDGRKYQGTSLDVTLSTIQPDKHRCFVANIYELECLTPSRSEAARLQHHA